MCGCGLFFLPLGFLSPNSFVAPIMCFTASISCLGIGEFDGYIIRIEVLV